MQVIDVVKLLLITVLGAVAGGCLIGILYGKHAVKKASSEHKPLLSFRERIVYLALLVVGAAFIAAGVFLVPSLGKGDEGMIDDPGMMMGEEGFFDGEEGFYDEDAVAADGQLAGSDEDAQALDTDEDGGQADDSAEGEEADADSGDAQIEEPDDPPVASGNTSSAAPSQGGVAVYETADGGVVVMG